MEFYPKVEKFVEESFINAKNPVDDPQDSIKHLLRTAYWLKFLKSDADEALLIAAVSHDIERAYRDEGVMKGVEWAGKEYYKMHEVKGAEIIADFLTKQSAAPELVERVKWLVASHEEGGDSDQNILKDADCISFLENNVDFFINKKMKKVGYEAVKYKFNDMLDRITSDKAKEIAKPFYEQAIKKLENYGGK